jgi:D-alanine-D-alanine ligase
MEAAALAADIFSSPVFVKPASAEGSVGVRRIEQAAELPAAIAAVQGSGDVLVQEARDGTEISVTVYQDEMGTTHALPPVEVHPIQASFFDSLAKRRAGRVAFRPGDTKNSLMKRAVQLARDIYHSLSAKGALTIDMIAHGNDLDLLEVNTVPVAGGQAPLTAQLSAAGDHPTLFVDSLVRNALAGR